MNAQSPKSISAMIHHSIVAAKIFLPLATKTVVRTSEKKERPTQGERPPTNANRVKNDKNKDKGLFKGKDRQVLSKRWSAITKRIDATSVVNKVMHIALVL